MNRRRIYLMRHGETLYQDSSGEGAIGGGTLTERGEEQIRALARIFEKIPLDRIYSSPLGRARETAKLLAREKGKEVRLASELREISLAEGWLTGKGVGEIFREATAFFKNPHTTWDDPVRSHRFLPPFFPTSFLISLTTRKSRALPPMTRPSNSRIGAILRRFAGPRNGQGRGRSLGAGGVVQILVAHRVLGGKGLDPVLRR